MSIFEQLGEAQAALPVQVTGGPAACSGRDLAAAHDHLGITPEDVDRAVGLLGATTALEPA